MMLGLKRLAEVEAAVAKRKQEQATAQANSYKQEKRQRHLFWAWRQFVVRKNERGLLFKEGDFQSFLQPGTYRYFDPFKRMSIEVYDLTQAEFQHPLLDFFLKQYSTEMARCCSVVELGAKQVAMVYENGILSGILPPDSRTVFWQGVIDVRTEVFDISEQFTVPVDKAAALVHPRSTVLQVLAEKSLYSQEVPEYHIGLLTVNGRFVQTLPPGLHVYWRFNRNIRIDLVDLRLQELEVSGQEILTKDKVSLRINLSASYLIKDVVLANSILAKMSEYLYRELQFGLRAAVGTQSLDELLENKQVLDEVIFAYIREKADHVGIDVRGVGIKDIILPGEMKMILSRVVEAEKLAQANLIRRREETAATRSLLNTAKVMEDNPVALRLKELEVLEKVTEKIDHISVYGGLEGLIKELVKLR